MVWMLWVVLGWVLFATMFNTGRAIVNQDAVAAVTSLVFGTLLMVLVFFGGIYVG